MAAPQIKNIKFFPLNAANNTDHQVSQVDITFPERVDFVVTESITNDNNQIWYYRLTRRDDRVFTVEFRGANLDGHQWIPSVNLIGIQLVY